MSDPFLARADPADLSTVWWRNGASSWRTGTYRELAATLDGTSCALLIDGRAVSLFDVDLPATDLRTARQAAPYAVEERLAQPVENVHLAVEPAGGDRYTAIAIERAHIQALGLELERCGIRPQAVTAEYFAVPLTADGWSIVIEGGMAVLRPGHAAGIKVALGELPALVPLLRREHPTVSRVTIYADEPPQALLQEVFAGMQLDWRPALGAADMLGELATQAPPALLPPSSTSRRGEQSARLWRITATIVAAAVLLYPALLGWQHEVLADTERELVAANHALVNVAFPRITRIVNLRAQVDQALAELRARAALAPRFLALLARVDAVRARHFPPGTRLTHVAYADRTMELAIEATDMDSVERARSALAQAGLAADTLAAESSGAVIVARLRLTDGA